MPTLIDRRRWRHEIAVALLTGGSDKPYVIRPDDGAHRPRGQPWI